MRPSPVTQKNLWRIVKLEWKKDYDLEVTESGSPSPWWMSWFTTRHTTKSRWLSICTDSQLSCLSRRIVTSCLAGPCMLHSGAPRPAPYVERKVTALEAIERESGNSW